MVKICIARYGTHRSICSDYLLIIALYALEARFDKHVKYAPGDNNSIIYRGTPEDEKAIQAELDAEIAREAACSKGDFIYRRWLKSKEAGHTHPSMKILMKNEVTKQELLCGPDCECYSA